MYESTNTFRVEEKTQNDVLVTNYPNLLGDVKEWMDATEYRVSERNMAKLKESCEERTGIEFGEMEKE
jgi:hypothetical protein